MLLISWFALLVWSGSFLVIFCTTGNQEGVRASAQGSSAVPSLVTASWWWDPLPVSHGLTVYSSWTCTRCVTEPPIPGREDQHLCTGLNNCCWGQKEQNLSNSVNKGGGFGFGGSANLTTCGWLRCFSLQKGSGLLMAMFSILGVGTQHGATASLDTVNLGSLA